jgi:hypothetical protein
MKPEPGRYEAPKYEHPVDEINWTAGVGRPAGVYWLDGRSLIAAHESQAEERLLERGAVLVATLRFDADPLDARRRGRLVERLHAASAASAFSVSGPN